MSENTAVSGFHTLDTTQYLGFTEKFISTFEEILTNFTQLPKTQAILSFYDTLTQHIRDPQAHDLDLSAISGELVKQLYRAYRDNGFTGSITDMLLGIIKTIEIATIEESKLGVDVTKAINVPDWQAIYQQHQTNRRAHRHIYETLQPYAAFNHAPSFYLSYYFQQQNELYEEDGYTITRWNPNEGTIYTHFGLSYHDSNEIMHNGMGIMDLWSLSAIDRITTCRIYFDVASTVAYVYLETQWRNSGRTHITPYLALPFSTDIEEKLVVIYRHDQITLRNSLASITTTNQLGTTAPYLLTLSQPLLARGTGIREISHYDVAADQNEQLFFLN